MTTLYTKFSKVWNSEPFIARLSDERIDIDSENLYLTYGGDYPWDYRICHLANPMRNKTEDAILLPRELSYLSDGDIIKVSPQSGEIHVLYRKTSPHNVIFLTARCNCKCLMCPQPPVNKDDSYLLEDWLQIIPLMDKQTPFLAITGGEPSIVPDSLLKILSACSECLPDTQIQILTNARMFRYLKLSKDIANIGNKNLLFGIALYSHIPHIHNYIVQTEYAYDQTIRGIMNLRRYGQRIELRNVLMKSNTADLKGYSDFIARNIPFTEHVALMGYEMTGYGKANANLLCAHPFEYQEQLNRAIHILDMHRIPVSIYNHPLCVLDSSVHSFARQSISDWKTAYFPVCENCEVKEICSGVFQSVKDAYPDYIPTNNLMN